MFVQLLHYDRDEQAVFIFLLGIVPFAFECIIEKDSTQDNMQVHGDSHMGNDTPLFTIIHLIVLNQGAAVMTAPLRFPFLPRPFCHFTLVSMISATTIFTIQTQHPTKKKNVAHSKHSPAMVFVDNQRRGSIRYEPLQVSYHRRKRKATPFPAIRKIIMWNYEE